MKSKLLPVAFFAILAQAHAQTLTTAPSNNGSGGIFMDLTNVSLPVNILSFETPFTGTVGTAVSVEVYTRPGTYVGFTGSNAGWTLTQTIDTVRAGSTVNSLIFLTTPILISGLTGVYLHCITSGGGIRYTGTSASPPQTNWSNSDLELVSAHARTGNIPFGGSEFTPRCFSGNVNYAVVPEPTTITALAFGVLLLLKRRAK